MFSSTSKCKLNFQPLFRKQTCAKTGHELSSGNEAYFNWTPGMWRAEGEFYTVKGKPDSTFSRVAFVFQFCHNINFAQGVPRNHFVLYKFII